MASPILLPCLVPLLATLLARVFAFDVSIKAENMYAFTCSKSIGMCNASLYHINTGLQKEQVASFYSVNSTQMRPIFSADRQDYLITVPCSCKNINGTTGYFYNTTYHVQPNDTFVNVSAQIYSGQAWRIGDEEKRFIAGNEVSMPLLCACVESQSKTVVTYTVQQHDTLSVIAGKLSASMDDIQNMNSLLTQNPGFIDVGWVLFVPMEQNGKSAPMKGM